MIVKSSLDIGGKILAWNEQEVNKLIKDKEQKLAKQSEQVEEDAKLEENASKEIEDASMHLKEEYSKVESKRGKRKEKVGE